MYSTDFCWFVGQKSVLPYFRLAGTVYKRRLTSLFLEREGGGPWVRFSAAFLFADKHGKAAFFLGTGGLSAHGCFCAYEAKSENKLSVLKALILF